MNSFVKWLRHSLSAGRQKRIAEARDAGADSVNDSSEKITSELAHAVTSLKNSSPRQTNARSGSSRSGQSRGAKSQNSKSSGASKPHSTSHATRDRKNVASGSSSRGDRSRSHSTDTRESQRPQADLLTSLPGSPRIVAREEHNISRRLIDPDALKILYRFVQYGHRAFLVGGGVRDLLLGRQPKDYDISSDVPPEEVRGLFRNSRIIGRRFRLNHVYFRGGKIIEVSTFRSSSESEKESGKEKDVNDTDTPVELLRNDNTYGDPETDAFRRDLTINGLFYDVQTFSVIDYVGGVEDLRAGIIRMIGEPGIRIQQDPVRMIRAVRHAARTGFTIEPKTSAAISEHADSILQSPKARVYEEIMRELHGGSSRRSYQLLRQYGMLKHLLPVFAELSQVSPAVNQSLEQVLERIDAHIAMGQQLSAAVTFAALMIENVLASDRMLKQINKGGLTPVFQLHPGESEKSPEAEESEEKNPVSSARSPYSRRSELAHFIDTYCKPIGVSKKERERMEDLLLFRWELIVRAQRGDWSKSVPRNDFFDEALLLIHLCGATTLLDETLEFWGISDFASQLEEQSSRTSSVQDRGGRDSNEKRKRPRGNRRRGGRGRSPGRAR